MRVINLYGGPGTGKSTTAAGLFYKMKSKGYKVELVTEYAKDKVYQESFLVLKDQLYIFAQQHHKLFRLRGKVDYVILDSPLLLSLHYFQPQGVFNGKMFKDLVVSTFESYDNINIFLLRNQKVHPYQKHGRLQTETEAIEIDSKIKSLLELNNISYIEQEINENILDEILDKINY